jgi:hypothetical protein
MAKQTVDIGSAPNDGNGDPLRTAFNKLNENFDELYLDSDEADTSVSPIILDLNNQIQRIFRPSANISTIKTWALDNDGDGLRIEFSFNLTSLVVQTFPSNFVMSDARWNTALQEWTPYDTGEYLAKATFNGTNWRLTIEGPFT